MPYFNAFMIPFMKDKPRESFPGVPPIPSDIRTLMERNKREELENLEKADQAAIRSGATTAAENSNTALPATTDPAAGTPTGTDTVKPTGEDPPPVVKPPVIKPPVRDPDPPAGDKTEGTKRKGKKGDG